LPKLRYAAFLELRKEEEELTEKLQRVYGLSVKQAYTIDGVMKASAAKRKLVMDVLKEIDTAKRDGQIRVSIGAATISKLQLKLGVKLY
jgi:hypothetical protein